MTTTLKRFKVALALDGKTVADIAKERRKTRQSLYRALQDPNFSRPLRAWLIKYTDRVLVKSEFRRAA